MPRQADGCRRLAPSPQLTRREGWRRRSRRDRNVLPTPPVIFTSAIAFRLKSSAMRCGSSHVEDVLAVRGIAVSFQTVGEWAGRFGAANDSHLVVRRRERTMKRFKSSRQCQRFVSNHGPIANLFHYPRNRLTSAQYRKLRKASMETWSRIAMPTVG